MTIPQEVRKIVKKLKENGFEAYIVGGCVRDFLLHRAPSDWDVATSATPREVAEIFPKNFSVNKFGTVTVLTRSQEASLQAIEVTTFRTETKYSDKRHPDKVKWAKTIEEDLARRDFTVNAIALDIGQGVPKKGGAKKRSHIFKIIDPFKGQKDIEKKVIRAVGSPEERFQEDALRLMRAVRLATVLGFKIERNTLSAIKQNAGLIELISQERIRDELLKIIMDERAAEGIELLRKTGLLQHILPELLEGYKVAQNKHHIYDVYEHSLRSLDFAARKGFNKYVRIAALLHDIGKPRVKEGEGKDATFYNHEIVGAKIAAQILERLKFSKKDAEKIIKLVRYHLFYYNVGEVQEPSIRRLVRKVGKENMQELVQLRMADRIGSGCPKALPYKLRHFQYLAEKVSQDPIDVAMLKIGGKEVKEILKIEPGPKVGQTLSILLGEVLDDPKKNKKSYLIKRVKEIGKLSDEEIASSAKAGREKREQILTKRDEMTKKKYWVS